MCQIFNQNLFFLVQAFGKWNNIGGSPCSIFQKKSSNIAFLDLLKYGSNGENDDLPAYRQQILQLLELQFF